MAVPYPPDGPVAYGQEKEHRVEIASRVIEDAIDELPTWEILELRLAQRLNLDRLNKRERPWCRTRCSLPS